MGNNLYTKDSIQSLSPLEFVRLRPSVYCGSTEYSTQLMTEILANSVDEANAGHGKVITISQKDGVYTVQDEGQGFLINTGIENGTTILERSFGTLNTSGKYSDSGVYSGSSLGLNGLGAKLATYLSNWLEVETWRDGEFEKIKFIEGVFSKRETGKTAHHSGTKVSWKPSAQFFTHSEVEEKKIVELIKATACLCPGLEIIYNGTSYKSQNGISDLLPQDNKLIKDDLNIHFASGTNKFDLSLNFGNEYGSIFLPYVNSGFTTAGAHISSIKTTITREFNKFYKEKKWIKENLSGDEIQEGMRLAFHITTQGVRYDGQLKDRITQIPMATFTTLLAEHLQRWLKENEKQIKALADKAINARKANEAARKAREAVRKPREKGLKAKLALSKKFTDCACKDPAKRNLLLVEGRSAGSSAVEARDPSCDCIYQLRGKTISPLKTSLDKILANQEMSDIIRILGAGFDKDFNVKKLNFNKIVIVSDADADGEAIELLLTTFFFTYMRPLIEAGKLYRAVTPLYIVRKDKEEEYFYTEEEMDVWRSKKKSGWDIIRAKGLGELNAKDLRKICFENERYKRITISDVEKSRELLEILEGKPVEPRKKFVYENAKTLGFNFD